MERLFVGKIVNTFGIKGELKVVSKFEMADKVYQKNNILFIGNKEYKISNVRFHKNNYLVELDNIKDINLIEYLIGCDIYFNKEDLNLSKDEFLISELINYKVFSDDKVIGIVSDYDDNKINPLIKVNNKIYIPLNGYYDKIDKVNKILYVKDVSGLIK